MATTTDSMAVDKATVDGATVATANTKAHDYHSKPISIVTSKMKVCVIPAWEDNYMYLLIDEATKQCAVIDPVEPQKVLSAVEEEGVTLSCVLTTHHHVDHASGNEKLAKLVGGITVYGGDDRIGALNNKVTDGSEFSVGTLNIRCLFTPCHTRGHICYYVTCGDDVPAVFTGDTLFSAGCGQFLEGTPDQMYRAFMEIFAKLPTNTRIYCGHEDTVNHLIYTLHVEPDNIAAKEKLTWAEAQRSKGEPTIPTTIAEELTYNTYFRVGQASVQKHVGKSDDVEVMAALRKENNTFPPYDALAH